MDAYEMVTNRIIEELEKGNIPWKKPWVGRNGAISHVSGKPYSLLNQILLGKSGEWLTYKQATAEGGTVRKGEKSRFVVFWKWIEKKETLENGEEKIDRIPFLRYINVFHISQCDGIKERYGIDAPTADLKPDEEAQAIFDNYVTREKIKVDFDGSEAYYRPSTDSITLPAMKMFKDIAEYYSTAFHEAVHSTGAKSRLDRDGVTGVSFFGTSDYSKEELIAEVGASMLLNKVGMETGSSFKNNAAYIQNWLKVLKNDKRFIVSAAGKAEKAVKFILNENLEEVTA